MSRYFLDTNILVYLTTDKDNLSKDVISLVANSTELITNTTCVQEFIQLHKSGRITLPRKQKFNVIDCLREYSIHIYPIDENVLKEYYKLEPAENHQDPFDHIIISHAISLGIPIISSDPKFAYYSHSRYEFIHNKKKRR